MAQRGLQLILNNFTLLNVAFRAHQTLNTKQWKPWCYGYNICNGFDA